MDKYEYRVKTEQMLGYVSKGLYGPAMEIADTVDWRKVKNLSMLSTVSEIYERMDQLDRAKEILLIANEKSPSSRKILYRLGLLGLKADDENEAVHWYDEFVNIAPKDPNQYILKYKILRKQNAPINKQINALEEFKHAEYVEKWAFELAKLYDEAGRVQDCVDECDDLILWFNDGAYIYQAMEMKMKYKPLTAMQQERFDGLNNTQKTENRPIPSSRISQKIRDNVRVTSSINLPDLPEPSLQGFFGTKLDQLPDERSAQAKLNMQRTEKINTTGISLAEVLKASEVVEEEVLPVEEEAEDIDIGKILSNWEESQKEETEEEAPVAEEAAEEVAELPEDLLQMLEQSGESAEEEEAEEDEPEYEEEAEEEEPEYEDDEEYEYEEDDEEYEYEDDEDDEEYEYEDDEEYEYEDDEDDEEYEYEDDEDDDNEEEEEELEASEEVPAEPEEIPVPEPEAMADNRRSTSSRDFLDELDKLPSEIEEPRHGRYDTGFVVQGRYDLSATSEIGLKMGLTEEQKKLFSYFVPIRGVSEQIVEILNNDKHCKNRYGTSRVGNIVVVGRKGNGKTVLAVDLVKAIQKQRGMKQTKVAIVTGEALNQKNLSVVMKKLYGGALIIENASKLNEETIEQLGELMEEQTGEMLFILEEQKKPLQRMFAAYPEFQARFTSRIELPVFINDELVTFGQTYAKENGYRIDDMGILALYSRIDMLQREDHAVTVVEVKEIMDAAMSHTQKGNVKTLMKRVLGKTTDEKARIILKEDDFKF